MRRLYLLLICASCMMLLAGCSGSGSSSTTELVTVQLTPLTVNVPLGSKQQFTAVTYNNSDTGVIWYVNGVEGGDTTNGTITQDGLYSAPSAMPNPSTVTVTVVAHVNTTVTQNAAVHLTSGISVSISPSPVDLQLGQAQQFTATVTGASDNSVTWYAGGVAGGNATVGTISSSGLYTAPTSASSTPMSVSVSAVSKVDTTKSATVSVTIHGGIKLALSPNPASAQTYKTLQFAAAVTGSADTGVSWQVNGVNGGTAKTGTISATGLYTAPGSVPTTMSGNSTVITPVTVTAISQADSSVSDSAVVNIFAPNSQKQSTPILLGSSGGNANDATGTSCCAGTLGALVSRGGKQYILSSSHVLAPNGAKAGDAIIQPGLLDASCSVSDTTTVANLSQFVNLQSAGTGADAALAEIVSGTVDPQGTILQLGATIANGAPSDGAPHAGVGVVPSVNLAVAKSGRSTGLTCATIGAIHVTVSLQYPKSCGSSDTYPVTLTNAVDIFGSDFSAQGDSGALIVTQDTADPVALLVASTDSDTVALPVSDALSAMADPVTSETLIFAGGAAHAVAGCNPASGSASLQNVKTAVTTVTALPATEIARAESIQARNAARLLALPGVHAVGVTASADNANAAALIVFVEPGSDLSAIPATVDGMSVRIRQTKRFQIGSGQKNVTPSCPSRSRISAGTVPVL